MRALPRVRACRQKNDPHPKGQPGAWRSCSAWSASLSSRASAVSSSVRRSACCSRRSSSALAHRDARSATAGAEAATRRLEAAPDASSAPDTSHADGRADCANSSGSSGRSRGRVTARPSRCTSASHCSERAARSRCRRASRRLSIAQSPRSWPGSSAAIRSRAPASSSCSSAPRSSRNTPRTTACSRSSCASSRSRSAPSHCSIVGWRLREKRAVYGQLLQGGGIAGPVSHRVCGDAALPPAAVHARFRVAGSRRSRGAVLAVAQNALALAVIGTAGGFLAPILVSTGSGNYVALFTYYAILNLGVFAVAWFRTWRVLNVLGFVFTFTITGLWRANVVPGADLLDGRRIPDPVLPDVRRGLGAELRAAGAQPEGLRLRLAGVRLAGRRIHLARDDDRAHRVRTGVERARARRVLSAARLDSVRDASRDASVCSSKRSPRSA